MTLAFSLPFSRLLSGIALVLGLSLAARPAAQAQPADSSLTVGSKKFTENVILGWMAVDVMQARGFEVAHRSQLGGSRFLWDALVRGDIDVYPEYTGTLVQEILAESGGTRSTLADTLARYGVAMTEPLGFNNTYAIGVRADLADSLDLRTIGDLRRHPELQLGFSNEFMDRSDGWPGLQDAYNLPQDARGVDHDLGYRGLVNGSLDAIDLYSTDAEIEQYDIRVLEDNRDYFGTYEAILLYRTDLPAAAEAGLQQLEGRFSEQTMQGLNARAKIDQVDEPVVAANYLNEALNLEATAETPSRMERVGVRTEEHLVLVGLSLGLAILLGIPLGILAAKSRIVGPGVLLVVGIIYTIPSLALLAVMVPPLGVGQLPAVLALFLYSLLPIVWNTYTGLNDLSRPLVESAEALGLSAASKLVRVEIPLAARSILAGVKIAAVINIGTATLGALIGAGGYGQPILTGIRRANLGLILEGTVPAAVLTILVLALLEILERTLLPRSMRT